MPTAALRPCTQPGCPALVEAGRCAGHAARANAGVRRWYHTGRWQQLRAQVLKEAPLCVDCLAVGRTAAATDVDHEQPHGGDPVRFWSRANLRGRCHACHSRKTRRGL